MQQDSREGLRPQRYPARPQDTVRLGKAIHSADIKGIDLCETLEDYIGLNETPGRPLGLSRLPSEWVKTVGCSEFLGKALGSKRSWKCLRPQRGWLQITVKPHGRSKAPVIPQGRSLAEPLWWFK